MVAKEPHSFKNVTEGAVEIAQQVRVLTALGEYPGSLLHTQYGSPAFWVDFQGF